MGDNNDKELYLNYYNYPSSLQSTYRILAQFHYHMLPVHMRKINALSRHGRLILYLESVLKELLGMLFRYRRFAHKLDYQDHNKSKTYEYYYDGTEVIESYLDDYRHKNIHLAMNFF